MPSHIEVCLEELDAHPEEECFVRCVAVAGGQPGLALDREGLVRWMPDDEDRCHGLWVSQDGRLMLHGSESTAAAVVERGHRSQEAPVGKPVVLIDQDILLLGGKRLLVHLHGETEELYEPERLTRSAMRRFFEAAAVAARLTLGGTALAAGSAQSPTVGLQEPPSIEVRLRPPAPVRRISLDCKITKQATKGGKLLVEASCLKTTGLRVGLYGSLIDKKTGSTISKGTVKITAITGSKIRLVATGRKKPVRSANKVRFYVRP
jgi:hypothetical protein